MIQVKKKKLNKRKSIGFGKNCSIVVSIFMFHQEKFEKLVYNQNIF